MPDPACAKQREAHRVATVVVIQLLGGFRVAVGARVVGEADWRLLKARALVKLIALAPRQRLSREQAMDALWPDAEADAAQRNFSYALHIARRALDHDANGPRKPNRRDCHG